MRRCSNCEHCKVDKWFFENVGKQVFRCEFKHFDVMLYPLFNGWFCKMYVKRGF